MANVQPQFKAFNDTIRLGRFDENQTLREKRDIIRKKLIDNLPGVFKKYSEPCPLFVFLDQGSYAMDTGTKPLNGDFDIDQGLYFSVNASAYPDPVVLKQRVYEALDEHTNNVQIRRSCVTVFYSRNNEPIYHVDLAVYSDGSQNADGKSRLAKGKQYSIPDNRFWEVSNPQQLTDTIFARFVGEDRAQFRRIVRYWKRWKAVNFPGAGGAAPNGIGLTIVTYEDLQPTYTDRFTNEHNDLSAMCALVMNVLSRFTFVYDEAEQQFVERLVVNLPVEPWNDVFARMTAKQMASFKTNLTTLKDALVYAEGVSDPVAACERLQRVFGGDFPVPTKEETATRHPRAITSSGNSA